MRNIGHFVAACGYVLAWTTGIVPLSTAAEWKLEEIVGEVRKQAILFRNLQYKYIIESVPSPHAARAMKNHITHGLTEVYVVRQDGKLRIELNEEDVHNNGTVFRQKQLIAHDGISTRLLYDDKKLIIADWPPEVPSYLVDPPWFALGRLEPSVGGLAGYLTPSTKDNGDTRTEIRILGESKVQGITCVLIERTVFVKSTRTRFLTRLWLAPQYLFLPVKEESLVGPIDKPPYRDTIRLAEDWREISPGIWCPFLLKFQLFAHPGAYGNTTNFLEATQIFQLIEISLNPNFPDEYFSNVPLPKDGVIETYRGDELVSRRIVGNLRDPERIKSGLPPWVWALGNVVLVALLLGVYLRYRTAKTTAGEPPEDDSRAGNPLRKSD